MNIAAMNVRILFQKNEVSADKYGNHNTTWKDYYSCFARTGAMTGQESNGEVIASEESLSFTVRWCKKLENIDSTKYRIICKGKTYNIDYVNPMGFKNMSIKFCCSLERKE
ncbi:phage head closure protein [Butyrivibrio sp. MB2005]|uniref:phage head closure protein n=1 Tax=Butyrivibrio sp. MB2005 TaxID=1280678 RepID=UPI00041541DB|nr:phage head closure protein [Butyrivibrio sp. MB2005]